VLRTTPLGPGPIGPGAYKRCGTSDRYYEEVRAVSIIPDNTWRQPS
jgi:hypothetical protein